MVHLISATGLPFPLTVLVLLLVLRKLPDSQALERTNTTTSLYEAPEPFPDLFGHDPVGNSPVPLSPDPLVRYTWDRSKVNVSELQVYRVYHPHNCTVMTLASSSSPSFAAQQIWHNGSMTSYTIRDSTVIQLDWGVERAAWFEFTLDNDSGNHSTNGWHVEAALSEFNTVYPGKKKEPVLYDNQTYRLETNKELYEGIRFTWLYFTKMDPTAPALAVTNVSLVAKVKPIRYQGAFSSSHDRLTQTWYRGAYGVRLNMEGNEFNSILIERGDRVAIQGDGHPTMATALLVFGDDGAYDLVLEQLWKTNSGHVHGHHVVDEYIMAYPLYWVGSVLDWYWATGDHAGFQKLVPDVLSIVDLRIQDFLSDDLDIVWMGWDDRLGNGWCFHSNHDRCPREGHLAFAALVVKVVKDVEHALRQVPNSTYDQEVSHYRKIHTDLVHRFRSTIPEYPKGLGVHSAANALSAGIATPADIQLWMNSTLNDAVTICSWSAFNQYWILQGFAAAERMEHAIESIDLCWGNMLDTGKGCFYELSSPDWPAFRKDGDRLPTMPSLCHPWASGVTAWMSSALAGIRPMVPGYSIALLAPYVSPKYPKVNGTVPTPHGLISVQASWDDVGPDSTMTINLTKAKLTTGYVGLRKDVHKCRLREIYSIGNIINAQEVSQLPFEAKEWTRAMEDNIMLVEVPSGLDSASFKASYSCHEEQMILNNNDSVFRHGVYPASISMDRSSRGDGLVNYGADGFLLLGSDNGKDVRNLPSYVSSIDIYNHGFGGSKPVNASYIGSSDSDPTYLPYKNSRSLGILGAGEDTYWNPGIVVDVNTSVGDRNAQQSVLINVNTTMGGRNAHESVLINVHKGGNPQVYKLSVYCVAKTKSEQFAIRVMDLSTLNVIAPTRMIDQHQEGIWWTVEYQSSIRLRIMGIYGMHISALAFSSPATAQTATS